MPVNIVPDFSKAERLIHGCRTLLSARGRGHCDGSEKGQEGPRGRQGQAGQQEVGTNVEVETVAIVVNDAELGVLFRVGARQRVTGRGERACWPRATGVIAVKSIFTNVFCTFLCKKMRQSRA